MTNKTVKEYARKILNAGLQVGDVVRFNKRPHYIYEIHQDRVVLCTMDEHKLFITLWG
jgi:hypothetical protein